MKVERVGESLGAEVSGVHLKDLGDREAEDLYAALLEHEVLFFRDSGLDDESHLALAARFGTPSVFPIQQVFGDTEPTFHRLRIAHRTSPCLSPRGLHSGGEASEFASGFAGLGCKRLAPAARRATLSWDRACGS